MIRNLWKIFLSLFSRGGGDNEDTKEDDSRFIPSPLDLSVRSSHGGSDDEIERELNSINEQAREVEQNRPEK